MPPSVARPRRALTGASTIALIAALLGVSAGTPSSGAEVEAEGSLSVRPSPAVAARISVDGVARNQPEIADLPLPAGTHRVCVTAPEGYLAPPCAPVEVAAGETTVVTPVLERSGTLHVTTEPRQSEAAVRIDGTVRDSAEVRVPLPVGVHEVCFGDVPGMVAPACEQVEVIADTVVTSVGRYASAPEPAPTVVTGLAGTSRRVVGNLLWSAEVTVAVRDGDGQAVEGVAASGSWSTSRPAVLTASSCTTGADGTCTVHVGLMATGGGNAATFELTAVDVPTATAWTGDRRVTVNRNGTVEVS